MNNCLYLPLCATITRPSIIITTTPKEDTSHTNKIGPNSGHSNSDIGKLDPDLRKLTHPRKINPLC
jgi:hypothetical protein